MLVVYIALKSYVSEVDTQYISVFRGSYPTVQNCGKLPQFCVSPASRQYDAGCHGLAHLPPPAGGQNFRITSGTYLKVMLNFLFTRVIK